ncbi:hypothetical protein TNCV_4986391 [Trichonephila clavipes]|nr:hypothetical protein TNCV_4986391 [Trichonephila clavipes]
MDEILTPVVLPMLSSLSAISFYAIKSLSYHLLCYQVYQQDNACPQLRNFPNNDFKGMTYSHGLPGYQASHRYSTSEMCLESNFSHPGILVNLFTMQLEASLHDLPLEAIGDLTDLISHHSLACIISRRRLTTYCCETFLCYISPS